MENKNKKFSINYHKRLFLNGGGGGRSYSNFNSGDCLKFSLFYISIIFILTYLTYAIIYHANDDALFADICAGLKTGTPSSMAIYSNIFYTFLISSLYRIYDGIAWYPLAFIFLMFISCVSIFYSLLKIFQSIKCPNFVPVAIYTVFHASSILVWTVQLQFTVVPSICGAAASALILQKENSVKVFSFENILFFALLFFSIIIREETGYIIIAFVLLVILSKESEEFIKNKKLKKESIFFASLTLLIILMPIITQRIYLFSDSERAYNVEIRKERQQYMDYAKPSYEEAKEVYEKIGWSEELYTAVAKTWFFWDERVTNENFHILNENTKNKWMLSQEYYSFENIAYRFQETVKEPSLKPYFLIFTCIISLLYVEIVYIKNKKYLAILYPVFLTILTFSIFFYLSYKGRSRSRSTSAILIPFTVCSLFMLFKVLKGKKISFHSLNFFKSGITVLLSSFMIMSSINVFGTLTNLLPDKTMQIGYSSLMEYINNNPDNTYVLGYSMIGVEDSSPFYIHKDRKPINFIGSSVMHNSTIYKQQYLLNGIKEPKATDFLKENMFLIVASKTEIEKWPVYLLLKADYGASGYEVVYDRSGVKIFRVCP